jgi:tetratricopeptide (TPR) repeat protein
LQLLNCGHRRIGAAVALISASLLAACAGTPQADALRAAAPLTLPATRQLAEVPFVAQDKYQCGPASLAMALRASGADADPEALKSLVYVPARQGSLQPEMLAAARRHGRLAAVLPPRLDAVLAEVAQGRPAVVLQNLALAAAPLWHYAVVIGYDLPRGEIVLHSGLIAGQRLSFEVFERTWARAGRWAMVATDPRRLPASVAPAELVAAAAALERVDVAAARAAFAALTERAPRLADAWFGLGNTAYAERDYAAARAAFERSVQIDSGYADAWNNLAHALLALDEPAPARAAAERAVALGGPRLERYRHTLAEAARAR